jgi:hypothetical protein
LVAPKLEEITELMIVAHKEQNKYL